jgi:hypothetical protein
MIVVLAFVSLIMPLAVEYICDRMAKRRAGPQAGSAHPTVLDGWIVPTPATAEDLPESAAEAVVFADAGDAARCATESRLARGLLDGRLDRTRYHAAMAALAAGAAPAQPPSGA